MDTLTIAEGGREALTGGVLAVYVSMILQWLKGKEWFPLLDEDREVLNRVVSFVVAMLTAVGVSWAFSSGDAGWSFTIGGPHTTVAGFIADVLRQFAVQHVIYRVAVAPRPEVWRPASPPVTEK